MDTKIIGSILLVVGTTIGAGMLALPIATAQLGFVGSIALLFICWFVMTSGALLLLEVNLWMPANSNLVTMARNTLGPIGQVIAWLAFLLLLYSLICAYISGGSGLLQYLSRNAGFPLGESASAIIFTLLFSVIVFLGIGATDYVNRGLMFAKLFSYLVLVSCLMPYITLDHLSESHLQSLRFSGAVFVTVTSFGFSVIVPSLRIYLNSDVRKLKKAILIGSLIPLICYVVWDMVIMGVIPLNGINGLAAIMHASNSTSALVANVSAAVSSEYVMFFTKLFTSICVLTSFLGVSLCLTDFLADGFGLEKVGFNRVIIHCAVYLPPLIIILIYPNAFIRALEYAGIYSVILLILIPAWMTLRGRRIYQNGVYRVGVGSMYLIGLVILSLAAIIYGLVC